MATVITLAGNPGHRRPAERPHARRRMPYGLITAAAALAAAVIAGTRPAPGAPAGMRLSGVTSWIVSGVTKAINKFFSGLVTDALNPLLRLLGNTLLSTPAPQDIPHVGQMRENNRQLAVALYVLVVLAAGIVVMTYESVHTRYGIRELAPRVVVAFPAANLSLLLAGKAVAFVNALTRGVLGDGVDPGDAAATLKGLVVGSIASGGMFLVFIGLALAVLLVVLLVTYVIRVMATIILIAAAPLALICYGLPATDGIARWWGRAFAGVLLIQACQSLILITAMRVFLNTGGWTFFGPSAGGLVNLLVVMALLYLLIKVPVLILQRIQLTGGRPGLSSTAIKSYAAYRTFGLLGRAGPSAAAAGSGPAAAAGSSPASADPYHRSRADRSGQYVLPLGGLRRVPRQSARPIPPAPRPSASSRRPPQRPLRQLALPFGDPWPWHEPTTDRGGQLGLPITARADPTRPGRAPLSDGLRPEPTGRGAAQYRGRVTGQQTLFGPTGQPTRAATPHPPGPAEEPVAQGRPPFPVPRRTDRRDRPPAEADVPPPPGHVRGQQALFRRDLTPTRAALPPNTTTKRPRHRTRPPDPPSTASTDKDPT